MAEAGGAAASRPPVHLRLRPDAAGPAPGSREAARAGCTCPRHTNRHGAGAPGAAYGESPRDRTLWLIDLACPVHRVSPAGSCQ